jgi:hypothetical protein
MTATNHILSGAALAVIIDKPAIALPAAFLLHFFLDLLPHYGMHSFEERQKFPRLFRYSFITDIVLASCALLLLLILASPWYVIVAAILSASPDLAWGYRFIFLEKLGKLKPPNMNKFNQFHADIQKLESIKLGFAIEAIFSGVMLTILLQYL